MSQTHMLQASVILPTNSVPWGSVGKCHTADEQRTLADCLGECRQVSYSVEFDLERHVGEGDSPVWGGVAEGCYRLRIYIGGPP